MVHKRKIAPARKLTKRSSQKEIRAFLTHFLNQAVAQMLSEKIKNHEHPFK
jgi:hypothetical protein